MAVERCSFDKKVHIQETNQLKPRDVSGNLKKQKEKGKM